MPEHQLEPTFTIVQQIGRRYGLAVQDYVEAANGIENTSLIVSTDTTKYVFRIYRHSKKTAQQVTAELDFMEFLSSRGIPVPFVYQNKSGQRVTHINIGTKTWQVIVMAFVNGIHPQELPPVLLTQMAAIQARMHLLAADYSASTGTIRALTVLQEKEFIQHVDAAANTELQVYLARGARYKLKLDPALPTGPCHMDYNTRNLLSSSNNSIAAVLDFDDLAIAPYVVCLAYSLWHVQDEQGQDAASKYLAEYQKIRPLNSLELKYLPAAMLFRHYVITAIKLLSGESTAQDISSYIRTEQAYLALRPNW